MIHGSDARPKLEIEAIHEPVEWPRGCGVRWLVGNGVDTALARWRFDVKCWVLKVSLVPESSVCPHPSPTGLQDASAFHRVPTKFIVASGAAGCLQILILPKCGESCFNLPSNTAINRSAAALFCRAWVVFRKVI